MSESELERLAEVQKEAQVASEFLDWLMRKKGYWLAEKKEGTERLRPVWVDVEKLVAEYVEIDLKELERQKQNLLGRLREEARYEAL